MKKTRIKRIISVLLSLLMVITALPVIPMTAAAVDDTWDEALDEYEYFFSVKTTDDADGWNWAYMDVYLFDDNTYTNSQATRYWIEHDIDDSGEEFRAVLRSTKFLDKVVVHVDFGGGWTWHDWAGDLTVKINGTNVISTSMECGSTPGSSSDRAFSNRITSDKYPKVDEDNSRIFVQSADSSTLSSDLTFRQGESEEKGITQGYLYAQLVDQYGVVWHSLEDIEIKSKTHPDYDIFEFSEIRDNKAVFNVTSTYNGAVNDKYHSNDHLSKLTLSYPWYDPAKTYIDGSDSQVATIPLEINFKYLHDVKINLNKELFAESKEYEGTQIPIDFGIPAGYRIKSFTKTGAGELVNNNDNTAVLTVGNGDVTVTGNKVANTYYIDYDKNAADATGEMTSTLATYDKASVSIKNSTFNREGYSFLGWNTKPDGTGTAFAGGAAAKKPNLTTENGAHVTLYAQWGKNVLTVVLNYPAETGLLPRTVNVNRLLSIEPEEFIDVDSSSGHYRYTGADRSLEKITEDMSVNLYYEKVEHNFGEPFVSVEPTCTTDGVETQMCEDCGYEKHTVIPAYHQDLRTDAGYAATCTDDGAETVIKCYACGEIVENGEVIPAYGHDYNYKRASWSFSTASGQLKGWATVTCKNDKTHTLTVEADVVKTEKAYDFTAYFDGYTATTSLRIGKDIFEINVNSTDGGTVTATPSVAFKNDVVYLNVERESHSYLTGLTATSGSKDIEIEDYSFVMPKGNVEVTAEFSDVLPNQCGDNAFWYYDEETSTLTIAGTGPMYDYDEVAAPWFAYGSKIHNLRKLNIEDGITYIGKCAFSGLGRIVYDVYIADSVTEIGERAFYYSDAVGHLRLSNKLEKIGDYAFEGCDQLGQQFVLPETVTSLGRDVFLSNTYVYTVYCLANPENLSWTNATSDFKKNKETYIVVYNEYLSAYQEKFGDTVRGTFIGGLERDFRNIIIGESEHGSVSADFAKAPSYQSIRLSAVPDEGYGFSGYVVTDADGNSVSVTNNEFYMPTKDVTVIGIFTPLYGVEIETPDGNGTADFSKTEAMEGETVDVTAYPNPGYRFDTLTVTDCNGTELALNGTSFTMPASNVTASVTFAEYAHQVNCTVEGPGTVTGNLYADAGDTVTLTVTPDTGAVLKSIYLVDEYGNSIEPDGNNSFTMPDCNVNLFATFEAVQYTITYQATNGTITGQETAAYGEEVKVNAVPDDGYILKDVYVKDWHDISFDKNSNTFIMPARNITVTAYFETAPFTISYYSMTNGTVTCSDLTPEPGTTVTVTPNPDSGYYLSRLYYHRLTPSGSKIYTQVYDNKFVMPYGDVIVGANFSKLSYPIIDKSKNGSIEANLTAEYDSEVICNLVPNDGYVLDSVSVKDLAGNDVACTVYGSSQRCKFTMPASAAIVSATFVKDETEYSITYSSGEHGSVSGTESSLPGKAVLINSAADEGYTLKSFSVKADGNDIAYNADLSFTMPAADVTVTAEYASTDKCGEDVYWKYDVFTKTLTVYGSGAMYDYDGTNMPWYGMDINRIVVDMGISSVGAYAFYESDAVTVYMADSIEKIGSYAFYGHHSLKAVHMPERLTEIDTYAFAYCDELEQLDFPSLLVYVRDYAFTGTTAMDKIWCDMTSYNQLQWGSEPYKLDEFKPNMGTTILVAGALRNDAQWYYGGYTRIINAGFYYTTVEDNTEKHSVTVTTDSFGTVKSDFDSAPAGRLVYLTITPLDTYELQSLTVTDANGDEIEVTNNTFIMPGTAVTVNATFARKVYDVVTRPTTNGTVSCANSATRGTSVPITATPDEGYALKSITVTDVNGNDVAVNNNAFTMPAASVTVSAQFERQQYGITYRPAAHGSISGLETAECGDSVAITVIPEQHYMLTSLTVQTTDGEDVGIDGTGFIMPDEPVIVRATFEKIDYSIVYKISGNGKVSGAKTANYGDEIALTVTPNTGAVLENLSVTDSNGDEIELTGNTFTMPAGKVTVTAKFSSTEYSITYGEAEHGTISGYLTANYDSSVTVNVTPEAGYRLDTLLVTDEEDNTIAVNGNSFTMPASNVSVTATFKLISSKVIYIKTADGAVSGPETAECGNTVSVSPIASVGAEFVSLTVKTLSGEEIELTGNSFTMPDITVVVKAQFVKIDYPITYNYSQGGTVTGVETANYNDSIELTVTPDTGYELTALTVTDAENNELTVEENAFSMPASAVTVNAVFEKIDYTITYPETQKGTVTGAENANYGDEVTLTVTPDEHCQLDSLSVKDGENNDITVTDGKFIMPASNVTISAAFVNTRYSVTYLTAEHGAVAGQELVSHGDEVTVAVTTETGYSLDTLAVTDGSGNEVAVNDYKFIMPESNATVEATFVKTDHAITYAETANGTVTGVATANYGDEIVLTITPDKDYTLDAVTVTDNEGNDIAVSNNSFVMPDSPVTVSVTFAKCYAYAVYDANAKTLTFKYGTHVPAGEYREWEIPTGNDVPWINYNSQTIKTVIFDPSFADARPTTTAYWFKNFYALTDIQGLEYLNTSEVTSMSNMFYFCSALTSLDLCSLDTSSVTDMSAMFSNCQALVSLDLSTFDTSNVTDMSKMFYYCPALTTLDLSFFDTSKSPNTSNMFCDCDKLETIYVEGIDTQWQASSSNDMFARCKAIVGGTGITYDAGCLSVNYAKANNGYFTAKTHLVTIGTVTGGTVEADKAQAAMNETVTLTATPDDAEMIVDYTVTDVNGNEIEVTNNQFTMPASDVTVSASFRYITFTVQWVVGGSVVETDEAIKNRTPEFNGEVAQEYSDGVKTYVFCGWNDGTNTYAADELPAVTADVTYTAAYTEADYDFDEPVWNWADDRSTATATFTWTYNDREYSKTVNAVINFNESETHPQYTATVTFKGTEYTDTVGVDRSASVNFATAGTTATVSGNVGEAVQFEPGNYSYWKDNADFATSTVRAKNSSGADISLDVTFDNETGKFSFVMPNDDISITIYYNKYREVPSGSFEHGTAAPDKARACAGEVVTYTTDVDGGWKIDEIHLSYRSGSGTTHLADAVQDEHNRNIWYLTMPADRNVYEGLFATFSEDANWHTITIEEAANGTVSHAKGGADTGDEVTLTVTPNDFYVLDSISVKDADENEIAVTNGKFTMPASDVTVSASFVPKKYTVQWKNGSEIVETDNVPYGTIPQFNGEAPSDYSDENNHYTFSGWNDGENTYAVNELPAVTSDVSYTAVYTEAEHSYGEPEWAWAQDYSSVAATFTCTVGGETETVNATVTSENSRDKITYTATAEFEGNTYTDIRVVNKTLSTVTVVPSENGTVTANLSEAYEGEEVMLTVNPNADSKLASLTVKDAENNEITVTDNKFTMPASDVTVTAVFEKLQLINMVEPYIDDEGAYILGTVEHYVDASGTNYAVNNDGSVGSVLESTALSYFDFELMSDGTYRVNHFTGPTANMTELVIPKTFNGKKITVVGSNDREIFYNSKKTQFDLVLNENITKIDQYTFYVLYVKEVKGDTSGLKTIGRYAFSWANSPGAYEISLDLNYDGTIQTDYCAFNNMKVTFNLKHSTKISFNTPNSQSISYNFTDAHVYGEPVWTWAEDYSSATATFTCTDSRCNHQENVAATLTSEVTSEQTCTDEGERTHTASVEFNGQRYTDTKNETIPATGVHSYSEPEWTWAQDYSTASGTFTCSVCGESTKVDATITSEVKNGKRVYTCTIEFEGDTYTDTKEEDIIVPANDIYNLTVEENIDVNILIDVSGHEANGEEIEKIVYTYPDATTQTRNTLTETVNAEDITTDANGYFVKSFTMAIAQVNEPIKAVIYFTNGTSKEIKVSVAGYCKYIIENASANGYSDKLVNLCYAALEYGKNAINYFGYEYPSDITYPEYTLPNEFNATPEITSQAGIRKGDTVTGIASTQMFIISNATMRLTFKDDISSLNIESVKVGDRDLTAEIVKTSDNRWSVDISGIYATELSKAVELTLSDGTYVKYAATDWAKSILNYSTNENSKALAKSLYYYSEAANEYFGG